MQCPIFSNTAIDTSKDHLTRISTFELTIGMTVVELDKPWAESDFLMRGFKINDPIDIDDLQAECNHVYIKKQEEIAEERMLRASDTLKNFAWDK